MAWERLRQRRDDAGHRALTLGFLAVSAGEPAQAIKYASRAGRLDEAPQLTGLLAAQASHLKVIIKLHADILPHCWMMEKRHFWAILD